MGSQGANDIDRILVVVEEALHVRWQNWGTIHAIPK
jgi:hypothetical protein